MCGFGTETGGLGLEETELEDGATKQDDYQHQQLSGQLA